jgi:2-C-methyl-D-erythritol 4-phosphate cytidylyltransferase
VQTALAEVPEDAVAVLVHDAARPLLEEAVVERVLAALAERVDGVVPALRLADTVKRVRGAEVEETLPRGELVAAQTPQAFPADVLRRAMTAASPDAPDCASVVEAAGGRVRVVEGDPRLLKVTTPADLELVESWLT